MIRVFRPRWECAGNETPPPFGGIGRHKEFLPRRRRSMTATMGRRTLPPPTMTTMSHDEGESLPPPLPPHHHSPVVERGGEGVEAWGLGRGLENPRHTSPQCCHGSSWVVPRVRPVRTVELWLSRGQGGFLLFSSVETTWTTILEGHGQFPRQLSSRKSF